MKDICILICIPNHAKLPYCQHLTASHSRIYLWRSQEELNTRHLHLMMSLGTTLLSGAVDALDALVRKTLVVLERRVEHCSFEGLDEVGMQLLCAMTLIAAILDRWNSAGHQLCRPNGICAMGTPMLLRILMYLRRDLSSVTRERSASADAPRARLRGS